MNGRSVYVLWSGAPGALRGPVDVTDVYGNRTRADASTLHPRDRRR